MFDLKVSGTSVVTMTSLELVDFINENEVRESELRHDHFMAKVPKVLGEGVPKFRDTQINPQNGVSYQIYRFPKREACLMSMSYSYDLQAKVFDRMTALEEKQNRPDPLAILADPAAMRGLLLTYTEKVLTLQATVEAQAPKVEGFDRIATADGSMCMRDAAKTLQMQEKDLKKKLIECRWVYRRPMGSGYLAYSDKLQQGLLEHKITTGEKSDGSEWVNTQARITAKGLAKLALELGQH